MFCSGLLVRRVCIFKIEILRVIGRWSFQASDINLLMKVKEQSEKVSLNSTFRKLRSWHLFPSLHGK